MEWEANKKNEQQQQHTTPHQQPSELFTWLIGTVCHIYRGTLMDKRIEQVKMKQSNDVLPREDEKLIQRSRRRKIVVQPCEL